MTGKMLDACRGSPGGEGAHGPPGKIGHEAGIDGIANVWSRAPGDGPFVLSGSHIESQNYAGWLDGALGVVYALEAARAAAEAGIGGVDVMAFADEEGHFNGGFPGSASAVGEPGSTTVPSRPDSIVVAIAPTSVATQGNPIAMASSNATGCPSCRELRTKTSKSRYQRSTSSTMPGNSKKSVIPVWSTRVFTASSSGPSPTTTTRSEQPRSSS